jgi:carboxylesterase type B
MKFFARAFSLSVVAVAVTDAHEVPIAHTRNGTIHGRYLSNYNQDLFLGIPYAQAPRLAHAKPIATQFQDPWDASEYGPTCYGYGSNSLLNLTQSEECLNLNIIRPAGIYHEKLPVLLWIYGGGYAQGSSADPMWNLTYIVDTGVQHGKPIIAVSINYRLAFFGFPGGPDALRAGITNLGLKDQRVALQWVQENIASFGGDPNKVTIWGESAGGLSVVRHLISYGGRGGDGLFRAAIVISGFVTGPNRITMPSDLEAGYQNVVSNAGCSSAGDTLTCLRNAPLDKIYPGVQTGSPTAFGEVIDGIFFQREPALELAAGHVTRVPIILGGDADEGLFFVNIAFSIAGILPNTTAQLRSVMQAAFPGVTEDLIDEVLQLYPEGSAAPPYSLPPDFPWCKAMNQANLLCGSQYRRLAAILGDNIIDAPRRYMSDRWASLGLDSYSFQFATNPTSLPIVFWNGLGKMTDPLRPRRTSYRALKPTLLTPFCF